MLDMLLQWYRRRFTDPQAIALLAILVAGFCILYFLNGILAPLLVAIVLAYLLEWPTVPPATCRAFAHAGGQRGADSVRRYSDAGHFCCCAGDLATGH